MACRTVLLAGAVIVVVAAIYMGHFADLDTFRYHGRTDLDACAAQPSPPPSQDVVDTAERLFFEGWYYKLASADGANVIALIPGVILREPGNEACGGEAFLMVVDGGGNGARVPRCDYHRLPPSALSFARSCGGSRVGLQGVGSFTRRGLDIDVPATSGCEVVDGGTECAAGVSGRIEVEDEVVWPATPLSPGAMGWFAWFPMQCNHGVMSMYSRIKAGSLRVGDVEVDFTGGVMYLEKDWGTNFPKSWIWIQGSHFAGAPRTSLFASVADIPWYGLRFPGFIMGFLHNGTLHRFATYTGARIQSMAAWSKWADDAGAEGAAAEAGRARERQLSGFVDMTVHGSGYSLRVEAEVPDDGADSDPSLLWAPVNGSMVPKVREALNGRVTVTLTNLDTGEVEFSGATAASGVEIMGHIHDLSHSVARLPLDTFSIMLPGIAARLVELLVSSLTYAAPAVAAVALLWLVVHLCKPKRHYTAPESVGSEYDAWTADGVLEHFWGEHVHHGYYPDGHIGDVNFKTSKVDMNDRLLQWAGVEGGTSPVDASLGVHSDTIRVLDVGCGIGGSSRYLARFFGPAARIEGVTLSPAQVARGRELTAAAGLQQQVSVRIADALKLPFPDNHFDLVWTMESGEHMPDKEAFLREMSRVLKPGGRVVMATWCTRAVPGDAPDATALSKAEVTRLRRVYDEWALPHFISIQQYARMAGGVGLGAVSIGDWTREAAPTWPHSVLEGAKGIVWLLLRGPRVFFRTLRDVFAIWHMVKGYEEGTIVYGIFTATKGATPTGVEDAGRAGATPAIVATHNGGDSEDNDLSGDSSTEDDSQSSSDDEPAQRAAARGRTTSPADALVNSRRRSLRSTRTRS